MLKRSLLYIKDKRPIPFGSMMYDSRKCYMSFVLSYYEFDLCKSYLNVFYLPGFCIWGSSSCSKPHRDRSCSYRWVHNPVPAKIVLLWVPAKVIVLLRIAAKVVVLLRIAAKIVVLLRIAAEITRVNIIVLK